MNLTSSTTSRRDLWVSLLLLLGVCALLFLVGLGRLPLLEPDEGRNAEVAREMLATGNWLVPHFNSLPYLDKPVFFFWLVAATFRLAGLSEFAARLPSALAALGTVLLTWWMARRMFRNSTALLAGLVLATSPLTIVLAREVIFDMTLAFLVTLAMLAYWLAAASDYRRPGMDVLMFLAMSLATLTKGPVGFLLPLLSILVYQLLRRRVGDLKRLRWGWGLLVFAAVVLSWFIAVSTRHPDFPRYALWQESLARFATGSMQRAGGLLYYLPVYLAGFFPWSFFLLFAGWNYRRRVRELRDDRHQAELFLLSWAGMIFVFFSISHSKLPAYFLPALVPLAVLTASAWHRVGFTATGQPPDWLTGGFAAELGVGLLLAVASWALLGGRPSAIELALARKLPETVMGMLRPTLLYSGLILAGLGIVGRNITSRMDGRRLAALTFALAAVTAPGLFLRWFGPLETYAAANSSRTLARTILASPQHDLPIYAFFYFRTSLPFYLQRPVILITTDGGEMTSNYEASLWRQSGARLLEASSGATEGPDRFRGVLVRFSAFAAHLASSHAPTLVLVGNYNVGHLTRSVGPRYSLEPLWTTWRDSIWEIPPVL